MPKMVHFGEFLKTWSLQSYSVTRRVSFNRIKIDGKCQNWKFKCDILSNFPTMCTMKHLPITFNSVNIVPQLFLQPHTMLKVIFLSKNSILRKLKKCNFLFQNESFQKQHKDFWCQMCPVYGNCRTAEPVSEW